MRQPRSAGLAWSPVISVPASSTGGEHQRPFNTNPPEIGRRRQTASDAKCHSLASCDHPARADRSARQQWQRLCHCRAPRGGMCTAQLKVAGTRGISRGVTLTDESSHCEHRRLGGPWKENSPWTGPTVPGRAPGSPGSRFLKNNPGLADSFPDAHSLTGSGFPEKTTG
ncbi:unnamed protein product [Merluccius merluccius]